MASKVKKAIKVANNLTASGGLANAGVKAAKVATAKPKAVKATKLNTTGLDSAVKKQYIKAIRKKKTASSSW